MHFFCSLLFSSFSSCFLLPLPDPCVLSTPPLINPCPFLTQRHSKDAPPQRTSESFSLLANMLCLSIEIWSIGAFSVCITKKYWAATHTTDPHHGRLYTKTRGSSRPHMSVGNTFIKISKVFLLLRYGGKISSLSQETPILMHPSQIVMASLRPQDLWKRVTCLCHPLPLSPPRCPRSLQRLAGQTTSPQ